MIISKHTLTLSFGIALIGLLGSACGPIDEHELDILVSEGELEETGEAGQDEGESGEGGGEGHDEQLGRCEGGDADAGDAGDGDGDGDGDAGDGDGDAGDGCDGDAGETDGAGDSSTDEPQDEGCTLTRGYWQTHNSEAQQQALVEAWPLSEDQDLCGLSWLDTLLTSPEGDAYLILASQWIAASLNIANGASTTPEVDAAMLDASMYMGACEVLESETDAALDVAAVLDAYNNGEIGPGHCE